VRTARDVGARAILTWTRGGLAARLISRERPSVPIIVPTFSAPSAQRLALLYGVRAVPCPEGRLSRAQLEAELGPLADENALLMVGHMTGEARRIPWMALTRVVDGDDWGRDPRGGRPGGLP
jgi:pyruvate kinase